MASVEIRNLHKRFGAVDAVRGLDFDVREGRVTGLLGPNGAGKSTTLRALLGLIHPSAGSATFAGRRYRELDHPSAQVGAVLEDASFHPGRSARNHLRVLAAAGGHPEARVDEVLGAVGLADAAGRRVKGYSMGMRQRLAIAAALIGDPQVLILDEPTNGLDPPGISWVRKLLRQHADEGRTVLISSHLLAEVAQSVDDVVVIANGELRGRGTLAEVLGSGQAVEVEVRAVEQERLAAALEGEGLSVQRERGSLLVAGATTERVGQVAARHALALTYLVQRSRSLEEAFFELTAGPRT